MQTRPLYFLSCLALTVSCASTLSTPDSEPYGPVKPAGTVREGAVSYNPNGLAEIVEMRRKDALKKMYDGCGKSNRYEILSETTEKNDEKTDSLANLAASEVKVLKYRCL